MNRRTKQLIELETLHELLPDLNYYQLLGIAPEVDQGVIEPAFRGEARRLHPDRSGMLGGPEVKSKANAIYRALNEAYRTLRDPDARAVYNEQLSNGGHRMTAEARQEAEAAAAAASNPELAARTDKGGKYWKLALQCWEKDDFNGTVMQIQFALMYEADNDTFKEWLEKAKKAKDEAPAKESNPYKLRIV